MLEHFFKSLVATVSDPYQCNRITDALAAAVLSGGDYGAGRISEGRRGVFYHSG